MSGTDSPFRGYNGIAEIVERLRPLVEFYLKNKPELRSFTIARRDYDLIRRWPKAAELHGFGLAEDGSTSWRGFALQVDEAKGGGFTVKPDNTAARYAANPGLDPETYPRTI